MRDIRHNSEGHDERSIRNIPVSRRKLAPRPAVVDHSDSEEYIEEEIELPRRRPRRRNRKMWLWAGGVVIVCALLGLLFSTVFAGATVTVYQRAQSVTVPATIQAQLNAPVGVLAFQTIHATKSASQSVPAQGTQHVSRPASGVVTISNTYSAASQKLIANTRFEAADGKIYRIRDSVTVPGMTGTTAGTVTASIYADSPGPDYNKSGSTSFTIPGFKGDPRYTKFIATAQGGITGGFVGDEPAVSAADLATAKTALQKQVDAEVRSAAATAIPEGFVAIPGTLQVDFAEIVQEAAADKTAKLTQSATATGVVVRQSDLASAIARRTVQDYKGEAVQFAAVDGMTASAASTTKATDATITINLTGQATLVWQFDPNALKQALVGKSKDEFQSTIEAFQPAVAKADASIRPFWQGKFPSNPDKITIKTATQ